MKITIDTEKPPRFWGKLKGAVAIARAAFTAPIVYEKPTVDGIVNRYIKKRIDLLESMLWLKYPGDSEELAFLKGELASGRHLVTQEEEDSFRTARRIWQIVVVCMVVFFICPVAYYVYWITRLLFVLWL